VELAADSRAKVSSRVSGILRSASQKQGDVVRRGAVLAVVESRELGEAALAYLEARRRLESARAAQRREETLWQRKISAKEEYLRSGQALKQARLAQKSAFTRLLVLGLTAGEVRALGRLGATQLTRHRVRAPITGTVTRREAVVGQALEAGTELFELADLSRLTISFAVRAPDLASLSRGMTVELHNRKLGLSTKGSLSVVPPVVDRSTRTGVAVAVFPNPDRRWRPGLCAGVLVKGGEVEVPVAVPVTALLELDGRRSIFVRRPSGAYRATEVEVGLQDGRRAEIRSGLRAGEVVAATNVLTLKSAWRQAGE
jgi:cobalt-zinc-cadmium efflux system membrane fusion protein